VILIFEIKRLKKNLLSSSKKQTIFGQIFKHPASWLGISTNTCCREGSLRILESIREVLKYEPAANQQSPYNR